jgi:hypothetical protein
MAGWLAGWLAACPVYGWMRAGLLAWMDGHMDVKMPNSLSTDRLESLLKRRFIGLKRDLQKLACTKSYAVQSRAVPCFIRIPQKSRHIACFSSPI